MGRALLDINVLIALLDQSHLLHRPTPMRSLLPWWLAGCFASFDQRIRLDSVPSAGSQHLCLIPCT